MLACGLWEPGVEPPTLCNTHKVHHPIVHHAFVRSQRKPHQVRTMVRTTLRQTPCSFAVVALVLLITGCQTTGLSKSGNRKGSHLRHVRTTPEYRETLIVAGMASASTAATCFDTERLWSKDTDWEPAVAVAPDTGNVYQLTTRWAWGGKPDPSVFVRRSLDEGATWQQDQQIYPQGKKGQNDPIIEAVAGGIVIAAWLDRARTLVSRTNDHGASWSRPVSIGASSTDFPRLAVSPDGQDIYVAFNGGNCNISASHDGGASFSNAVTAGSGGGTWYPAGAEIAPNGDVYFSASVLGQSPTIRVLRSVDGGASGVSHAVTDLSSFVRARPTFSRMSFAALVHTIGLGSSLWLSM